MPLQGPQSASRPPPAAVGRCKLRREGVEAQFFSFSALMFRSILQTAASWSFVCNDIQLYIAVVSLLPAFPLCSTRNRSVVYDSLDINDSYISELNTRHVGEILQLSTTTMEQFLNI